MFICYISTFHFADSSLTHSAILESLLLIDRQEKCKPEIPKLGVEIFVQKNSSHRGKIGMIVFRSPISRIRPCWFRVLQWKLDTTPFSTHSPFSVLMSLCTRERLEPFQWWQWWTSATIWAETLREIDFLVFSLRPRRIAEQQNISLGTRMGPIKFEL